MSESSLVDVKGTTIELSETGKGRPVLFLHGIEKLATQPPLLSFLARRARVLAPSHPGFGRSPLPDSFDAIDDLSYLYLDLIDSLALRDVVVVGASMGGWIAADMAVKCQHRLSHLALVSPFGIKISDRETRDIPDIFALPPEEVSRLAWHARALAPDLMSMPEDAAEQLLKQQEAAALFLWEPYMHHPKLRRRLRRINRPTLVLRGAHDGLVSESYASAYCDAIPGARYLTLSDAGHCPEYEQPEQLAEHILLFAEL